MEMRKRCGGILTTVVLCVLGVGTAPTAGAHASLVASRPAAGAVLSASPTSVAAIFDEAPEPAFATMTVLGPGGSHVSTGSAVVSGSQLSVEITSSAGPGTYTIAYRLMATDGHVVDGSWSFTVQG